jgi:3-phosphoshikimate 1-carboxyvinyltransferase
MRHLTLDARKLRPARLTPPPSKSDALRLLALASLLNRPAWLEALGPRPWASDIESLAVGLKAVIGSAHEASAEVVEVDCRDGAAPLRILLALSAIQRGRYRFTGTPRLGERSHAPLLAALRQSLGGAGLIVKQGGPWPIEVDATGETAAPLFRVSGAESSQPVSSLALAAGALALREHRPWTVEIADGLVSAGYLDLTLRAMAQAGFRVEREDAAIAVLGWDAGRARQPELPTDWSAAGFLLPIAWRIGGSVAGLDLEAPHPDRSILGLLAGAGLTVAHDRGETRVTGAPGAGLDASGREHPDLIPALAALACALPEPSVFTDLARLRHKESDRLAAIQELVTAGGGRSRLAGECLRIEPPATPPSDLHFDARNDHRMIMAAATLAILFGARLELGGAAGVEKSFPGFFRQLELASVELC